MWTRIDSNRYILSGAVTGMLNGVTHTGATVQLTADTGPQGFTGSATLGSGNTNISPIGVPEPSSLVLLLTGSLGMLGTMRRKLFVG
jgi:hypothetical protein